MMTAWMPPCFYDVHTTEYRVGKKYQIIVKINTEMIHVSFITDVCIYTTHVTQWRIICDHQHLKMTFFQETAITTSALLHMTWKGGHYMLQ